MKTIFHRDGTVTFWSVYQQVWVSHCRKLSDRELASLDPDERAKVIRHLKKQNA